MNLDELLRFKPDIPEPQSDQVMRRQAAADVGVSKKRKSRFQPADDENQPIEKRSARIGEYDMEALLADAEVVVEMDETEAKKLILKLEKSALRNQQMRLKFSDTPQRFMESEVELHTAIQQLHLIATSPHLYTTLVQLNVVTTLLQLLSHENSDIACQVIDLLQELTDVDPDDGTALEKFVSTLIAEQLFLTLAQTLERLDESVPEEADAVHRALSLLEQLCEFNCQLCISASQQGMLVWILKRMRVKAFDTNKAYCAEILAVILQNHDENRLQLKAVDGIDTLLQQLATYKRHDPANSEEAEYMENLFDSLCSALMLSGNKEKFLKGEGLQLMNLMLRERKLSRCGAVKVLDYALSGSDTTELCQKFVEILGLRSVFPLFMKPPKVKRKATVGREEMEERLISVIASLLRYGHGSQRQRLLAKFTEKDHEKVDRLMELHFHYQDRVRQVDEDLERERQRKLAAGENPEEDLDEEEEYLRRLDAGLYTLQLVDYIMLEATVSGPHTIKQKVMDTLNLRGASIKSIRSVLRQYAGSLGDAAGDELTAEDATKKAEQDRILQLLQKF